MRVLIAVIAVLLAGCTITPVYKMQNIERRVIADSVRGFDAQDGLQITYHYKDHPRFDRIEINHIGAGLNPSAVYVLTFCRDGRAIYVGKQFVERIGTYTGDISWADFARLSYLLDRMNFVAMEWSGIKDCCDHDVVYTRVWLVGETKPIVAETVDNKGSIEFWAFRMAAERIVAEILWKRQE